MSSATKADLAVRLVGRCPGRCRNIQHMLVDLLGDRHANRVGQPPSSPGEPGDEAVGAARGVGAEQGPALAAVLLRHLGQGQLDGCDVVGGCVPAPTTAARRPYPSSYISEDSPDRSIPAEVPV